MLFKSVSLLGKEERAIQKTFTAHGLWLLVLNLYKSLEIEYERNNIRVVSVCILFINYRALSI